MKLSVLGGGAFGTALAIALSRDGQDVVLWARSADDATFMQAKRKSGARLPGHVLPDTLKVTHSLAEAEADICLLAIPTQRLAAFLLEDASNYGALVACCKGLDQATNCGPVRLLEKHRPNSVCAMLTGPSFAVDIASGLPTALVLACADEAKAQDLQARLSRPLMRIYRTTDVIGAELGGALKNVVALAAGMAIGAGLGDSARASVIARGFAEMSRYASAKGASPETLYGLSGLGDLVLTCTSEKSRNFSAGVALSSGEQPTGNTVEGIATAGAVVRDAKAMKLEMPLMATVSEVVSGKLDIPAAINTLLTRPVGTE